ncbi:hypothetical protein CEXT_268901, partial [Caerostris extrusa]
MSPLTPVLTDQKARESGHVFLSLINYHVISHVNIKREADPLPRNDSCSCHLGCE